MYQVTKRDGKITDFHLKKIVVAITKAFEAQEIIAEENVSVEERKTLLFTMKTCPNCKVAGFMLD